MGVPVNILLARITILVEAWRRICPTVRDSGTIRNISGPSGNNRAEQVLGRLKRAAEMIQSLLG
jgi:hypothetical protein